MAPLNISNVRRLLESGSKHITGPYVCYVTGYESSFPRPRRFTYKGYNFLKPNGLVCARSLEFEQDSDLCHDGSKAHFYRFDISLEDAREVAGQRGPIVHTCIFYQARNLLRMGPVEFHTMEDSRQVALLQAVTMENPLVRVWIRTYADGRCVVQRLENAVCLDSPPSSPPMQYYSATPESVFATPRSARGEGSGSNLSLTNSIRFHTPCPSRSEGVGTTSSNRISRSAVQSRNRSHRDEEDSSIQKSLADILDILADLSTRDR